MPEHGGRLAEARAAAAAAKAKAAEAQAESGSFMDAARTLAEELRRQRNEQLMRRPDEPAANGGRESASGSETQGTADASAISPEGSRQRAFAGIHASWAPPRPGAIVSRLNQRLSGSRRFRSRAGEEPHESAAADREPGHDA